MKADIELLNFIYQNAQMGVETLGRLLELVEDGEFKRQLRAQHGEYLRFQSKAEQALARRGCDEKGLGAFERLRTYLMLNLQTLTDKSPAHIAELLIVGSNMGVLDAKKRLARSGGASADAQALMRALGDFETENVKKLEAFL